jgi:hypothetical protein
MTAPETVLGEVEIQVPLCQPPERAQPGLKHRPLTFGRVAVGSLFADAALAVFDLAMIVNLL